MMHAVFLKALLASLTTAWPNRRVNPTGETAVLESERLGASGLRATR